MSGVATAIVGSTIVGGYMASKSAKASANAATQAANTSAAASNYATDVQKQIYDQTREDQTPWRDTGAAGVNQLAYLMGLPAKFDTGNMAAPKLGIVTEENFDPVAYLKANPDVAANPTFAANPYAHFSQYGYLEGRKQMMPAEKIYSESPGTSSIGDKGSLARSFQLSDFTKDPGYNFRLSEGIKNLDRSAAARGGLLSGAQLKGVNRFNQDYASNEYQNAYNRYNTNQTNQFNRLASISGVGQTANSALQQAGQNYGQNVGNIAMTNAANTGNAQLAAGQAQASMYQGVGNALSGAAQGLGTYFGGSSSPTYSTGYNPSSTWDYNSAMSNVNFYGGA